MPVQPQHIALFFLVAMLAVTVYFLLGSVPLLILKHDNPIDARFIRSFYRTYYRIVLVVALGATLSFALAARPVFAMGAAVIVLVTWMLHRRFLPWMETLGSRIHAQDVTAIPAFRNLHKSAIGINVTQLLAILGSLGML